MKLRNAREKVKMPYVPVDLAGHRAAPGVADLGSPHPVATLLHDDHPGVEASCEIVGLISDKLFLEHDLRHESVSERRPPREG